MTSKKQKISAVFNDSSLSAAEKVDRLLKIKQEDREFKDAGGRIPDARKEIAAFRAVYKHEDEMYMQKVAQEFDKYNLNEETKRQMLDDVRKKYGYEIGTQRLIERGDDWKKAGVFKEAIKQYLRALRMAAEYQEKYPKEADVMWYNKAAFMIFNSTGIAYSKLNKSAKAMKSFQNAFENAPNEKAKEVARGNLEKATAACEKKARMKLHTTNCVEFR